MGAQEYGKERPRSRRLRPRGPASVAQRLLAVQPRSVGELRRRLREKGCAPEDVERVVAELQERGLLDDARFARDLVETTVARVPVGRYLLARKLRQRGVPEDVAYAALAETLPPWRESTLARAAVKRKRAELARRGLSTSDPRFPARLARFLLSRGFPPALVRGVLEEGQ